ncbi:tetratricopeptide repeat-containing sensor histidine kinase [uncultured Algibacter sp.]|uniref:ATP-binding protein n=1 Tax=uncultured Algibacter sp. TaxID=298659 RepID=UPI003217BEEC
MKKLIFFYFILLTINAFSQKDKDNFLLEQDIKEKCQEQFVDFHKAHVFFFKKQKDSSFFYSSQAYNNISKEPEIKNYLNYMYGVNAIHKKFFSLAQEKLKSTPNTFPYKYLVNYNLGNIALNNSEYDKALAYYISVINSDKVQSNGRLKRIYHNIGICYLHLKKYDTAKEFLLKELNIAQNEKDTLSIIYSKLDLGNLFYQQYKDSLAISYFKEAYNLAVLFPDIESKQTTAQNLAIAEKNRKHYKASTTYYAEYVKWKDSLWNRDKISELLEKDKQIALAIKDKEVTIQKEISKKQKERIRLFIIILIIALLFLAILFYLYRVKTKQHILINEQKEQLEQLNTTKNYLLSVVSHDLRSPTNALVKQQNKLMQQIVQKDFLSAQKITNTSIVLTKSLQHLLNNVLNWSLEQSNKLIFDKKKLALTPIIHQILFDFKSLAEVNQIEIKTDLNDAININVDSESLKIILRNILDNAIKYTHEKGEIKVTTTLTDNNTCCIEIKDSGHGISLEQLTQIKRLKELNTDQINRSKGVGLGLLLCIILTKKNDAILDIESALGKGTTIKIFFPTIKNIS